MIRHIVFDVGNVLFAYDPPYILHQLLPDNPYHHDYLTHLIHGDCWQQLDRGSLDRPNLYQHLTSVIPDPNLHANLDTLLDHFVHHLSLIQGSKDLFMALRPHYSLYLLTNFQAVPFSRLRELHPFLMQVDGAVVSAHHHEMKPEAAIYHRLLNRFGLAPKDTLFIDDLPDNIAGAQAVGMHGVVFQSPDQLRLDLAKPPFNVIVH